MGSPVVASQLLFPDSPFSLAPPGLAARLAAPRRSAVLSVGIARPRGSVTAKLRQTPRVVAAPFDRPTPSPSVTHHGFGHRGAQSPRRTTLVHPAHVHSTHSRAARRFQPQIGIFVHRA